MESGVIYCVTYFDHEAEEFAISGLYSKPEDAEAHKRSHAAHEDAFVEKRTLKGLKAQLLKEAIRDAKALLIAAGESS